MDIPEDTRLLINRIKPVPLDQTSDPKLTDDGKVFTWIKEGDAILFCMYVEGEEDKREEIQVEFIPEEEVD